MVARAFAVEMGDGSGRSSDNAAIHKPWSTPPMFRSTGKRAMAGMPTRAVVQEDYIALTGAAAIRNMLRPKLPPPPPQLRQCPERRGSAPPAYARSRRTEQPPRRIGHLLTASELPPPAEYLDHPTLVTEYSRSYCPPRTHAKFSQNPDRTGMKTEAWSRADGCIYLASPMMCRDNYLQAIT